MPLKKYLNETGIAPEVARAMVDAFATVIARMKVLGLKPDPASIAQRVSSLAHAGETDAARLAEAVLRSFAAPKK